MVHALDHASVNIQVPGFQYECEKLILYDGMSEELFCATRRRAFTRDLLDAWMFDVCEIGISFRDAFSSWKRKSCSHTAISTWIEQPPLVKRPMGNVTFNAFIKTL